MNSSSVGEAQAVAGRWGRLSRHWPGGQSRTASVSCLQPAHYLAAEREDLAGAGVENQADSRVWPSSKRTAVPEVCRAAAAVGAMEGEGEIGFGEVVVAADLDGAVSPVFSDLERDRLAPRPGRDSPLLSGVRGEVDAREAARLVSV